MNELARIIRDERGTSVVELALLAPILASLVIGITDLSLAYSEKLQLEQAAQRSIEKAMNGKKESALFVTLKTEAMAAASVASNAVQVKYWLECNGVSQNTSAATMEADYGKVCPNGATYARYVNVRIQKNFEPVFSSKWLGANPDGSFTLVGEAGIRVQ